MRWLLLPLLGGCWLERVTGEEVPLDPRFYEAVEKAQGKPGEGGGNAVPFATATGPMVTLSGKVSSPAEGPIDIDVRTPDPSAEGGMKGHGKVLLDGPGAFTLKVPRGIGDLELQAFQDLDGDGPGGQDPFGQQVITIGETDLDTVALDLVPGARGVGGPGAEAPVHQEMPPGAPGGNPSGGGNPGSGPGGAAPLGAGPDPFAAIEGPRITLRGTLDFDGPGVIDIDLFQPDPAASGGRRMLGKLKRQPGPYTIEVPANFGPLIIEALVDEKGDGPSLADPTGTTRPSPLPVGAEDIVALDITLAVRTPEPPAPPPPPDRPITPDLGPPPK